MSAPLIKNPAKYIAELFRVTVYDPRVAIADNQFSRQYNIYQFSIASLITDEDNYWIQWGGYFDNPIGYNMQIYLDQFLTEVFSESNLIATDNSFYIDQANNILYVNIPRNPWRYFRAYAAVYESIATTFATAPKNESNLSDIYYGDVPADPRMKVPTLNVKLNNVISGIITYNAFSIQLFNDDGKFDTLGILEYFNTPLQISKTTEDAQTIEDFNLIRKGIINDIKVDFDSMEIEATDQFYVMNKEYCRPMLVEDYPNLPDSNINELMAAGWGPLTKMPLYEVNKDTSTPPEWIDYIALDPDYITACSEVYDSDGNELAFSFNATTGIIHVTELDDDGEVIEGASADVTGDTDNSIGEIIIASLERNENIAYVEGIWDVAETDLYLALCADVGFSFSGGTTKELIEQVIKNDIAYLLQKNNGLLTIRQWGQTYETHFIPFWATTKKPKKDFKDASKYFCSSAKILFNKDHNEDKYLEKYIDDTREMNIFQEYRKLYMAEFETDLLNSADREDSADRILDRFGEMRETLKIGVGVDTFEINPLDTIIFEAYINDRNFSKYSSWIVKEVDPGQDELTIEGSEVTYLMSFDDVPAQIDKYYWGINEDQVA